MMEHALLYNFKLMLFVSCSFFLHAKESAHICKENYENGELYVDCSNMKSYHIPQFPSQTFSLNLQHNSISSVYQFLKYTMNLSVHDLSFMTNLTILDLSFNNIEQISNGWFNGLEKLQQLRLNDNKLLYSHIPIMCFQPLKSLKLLSIEHNYGSQGGSIFPNKAITHLTKLEILKLVVHPWQSEQNSTKGFGKEFCKLLHLNSLHLSIKGVWHKNIQLNNNFFQYTPNITQLHFFLHAIVIGFDTFTLTTLDKLKLLQIDYGNINRLSVFYKHVSLSMIQNSILKMISKVSNSSTEILIIQNLLNNYLKGKKGKMYPFCVQNLLVECLINTSIRQLHLINIFGSNQYCTTTQVVINAPPSLQLLNLTRNKLTWIALNLSSVVTLDLKHNRLGNYLVNNSYLITQSSKLENIYLSHNYIYKLNTEIFNGQPNLKHIDLSFNSLSNISFDPSHLENLQILNLTNNNIKFLNEKFMKKIVTLLKKNNNTKIDMRNNLLQCNCYTVPSLKLMWQIRQHFIKFSQYQCTYVNGTRSKANSFDKVIPYLVQDCFNLKPKTKNTTNLTFSVSLTIFGIIAAMLLSSTVVIYKQRWKLRYLYYTAKMKYTSIENADDDSNEYDYDAFISYSDEDRIFVIDHCIKNLEQDRNLKLCIHERDFIPGHDINNNMVTAIQTSRKTICIITKSFLESDFCMFELNMARMESTHSRKGKNILFLVFLEKLSSKDLPLLLCEHIQKQSYIQYPSNEIGIAIFWNKISDAINA